MNKHNLRTLIRSVIKETIANISETFTRGEWWIYPGGDVQFADGNIGDSGHEGYAIEHVEKEILSHFGIDTCCDDLSGFLNMYDDQIKQNLIDDENITSEELETWDDNTIKIIIKKALETELYKDAKQAEQAVYIAYGSNRSDMDARDYAMKYLRWKRLDIDSNGVYVQTWFLTNEDLRDIARGVSDAGGESYDDPNDDPDENKQDVNIEVRSNNYIFKDIPMDVVDLCNVMKLGDYRVRAAWINEGIFHEHKEWIVYEGENKIVTVFEDNSRLSFEIGYPKETWGENRRKWRHKAASKWKSLAREMYNGAGLNEVGNPVVIPWKKCYREALNNPEMKEFVRKNAQPIFEGSYLSYGHNEKSFIWTWNPHEDLIVMRTKGERSHGDLARASYSGRYDPRKKVATIVDMDEFSKNKDTDLTEIPNELKQLLQFKFGDDITLKPYTMF